MIEPAGDPASGRDPGLMPPSFATDYVEGAVKPFFLSSMHVGAPLQLPMIDLAYSKEKAVPAHIWGMLYDDWQPQLERDGLSVFLQGYENRGPDNERKRIYASATTSDLYDGAYAPKVQRFLDRLLDPATAGAPFMRRYLDAYFDLYWDLHLGVSGEAIPAEVRRFGQSFNAVLGWWFPTLEVVHENYQQVRTLRAPLIEWIGQRVQDIVDGTVVDGDKTFVHYWLANSGTGENFRRKDIVFECFHNFIALSQWGNTIYNIITRLETTQGDPVVRAGLATAMGAGLEPGAPDGDNAFTPMQRFVMELFRTISPNSGSLSVLAAEQGFLDPGYATIIHPHPATSSSPTHWADPEAFDPDRYQHPVTSDQPQEDRPDAAGLARCPFSTTSMPLRDGRRGEMANGVFGTVHGVVDGRAQPVYDAAGYAPFGFGYRRCAGELLTVRFIEDFLRRVWADGIRFTRIDAPSPEPLPVGPGTVISDDLTFAASSGAQR